MITAMLKTLRWSVSLGAKFGRVVPLHTLAVVLLTLVSLISTLLAFFLPLKVVVLLGSEGMPRYFPASFAQFDRDTLIAYLGLATAGFFLLHLLAEKLIGWTTERATRELLAKSQKMTLFENQDEIAANAYQRYSRAFASAVFVTLALLGLGIFYPGITALMLGYMVFAMLVILLLHRTSAHVREQLESRLASTLNLVAGFGFFFAFGYLLVDFIFWTPPGFIIAIVALIASRQIMQRACGAVGDLAALQNQRLKLDALFFHGKVLLPQRQRTDKTIWPLLAPDSRGTWLRLVLAELTGRTTDTLESTWHQLGVPNVAGLNVETDNERYLFKLFDFNRNSLALHEVTLLGESLKGLPALPWIGATQVQRYHCLVYELPTGKTPSLRQTKKTAAKTRSSLLAVEPSKALAQRFQRSKPMLWQRLDAMMWDKLNVAADTAQQHEAIADFLMQLPVLMRELRSLPLVIVTSESQQDSLWLPEDGAPVLINWGNWSLEPVGAGWLDKPDSLQHLASALVEAAAQRPTLASVPARQAELAALAFALERECNRQRFVQALELLPLLLERLTPLEEPQSTEDAAS